MASWLERGGIRSTVIATLRPWHSRGPVSVFSWWGLSAPTTFLDGQGLLVTGDTGADASACSGDEGNFPLAHGNSFPLRLQIRSILLIWLCI
jgi:hypothetical protein